MLTLDEDELRAVASLLGQLQGDEYAASVALGDVRLRARGLLSGPDSLVPPRLKPEVAEAVRAYLSPEVSIAVAVDRRNADLRLTLHGRGDRVVAHTAEGDFHGFTDVPDPAEALLGVLRLPAVRQSIAVGQVLEVRGLEAARQAAAAGDRGVAVQELRSAGADEMLAEDLGEALLHAECIAQFVRPARRSLTVLIARGAAWTFSHVAERTEVFVERPTAQRIREQVAALLARDAATPAGRSHPPAPV